MHADTFDYNRFRKWRMCLELSKGLTYTAVTIWRIVKGKVVEGWGVYDQMDFLKQLGVIEYKGFPDEVT